MFANIQYISCKAKRHKKTPQRVFLLACLDKKMIVKKYFHDIISTITQFVYDRKHFLIKVEQHMCREPQQHVLESIL